MIPSRRLQCHRWIVRSLLCLVVALASGATARGEKLLGEWPLPGHDVQHTAQAELPGDMREAPQEIGAYDPGRRPTQDVLCADVDDDGEAEVLYGASPVVCRALDGTEKWRSYCGAPLALADIDGDGKTDLLTQALMIARGATGEIVWRHNGPGSVGGRIMLAKLLPEKKGLQIACISTDFGEMTKYGQVWRFDEGFAQPQVVWQRGFATWEHAGGAVGQWDADTTCLMAPTWGGFYALNARDGSELMRLYWEGSPGKNGLRNYGPLTLTDLDGDGKSEFVIMAREISLHMNVFAPWRGTAGKHSVPENPWPAPKRAKGELASYDSGPLLWQRDFGTWYPTEEYLLDVPTPHIADVDGDGRREILASVGKGRWELKIYDGMTGVEKASLPDLDVEGAVDLHGDEAAEIVARHGDDLVIGSFAGGHWVEQLRLANCRMVRTLTRVAGPIASEPLMLELRPATVTTEIAPALVAVKDNRSDGSADAIVLINVAADGAFTAAETPIDDMPGLSVVAAAGPRLVATTSDGVMHVMYPNGEVEASWDASVPFVAGFSVADLDGDGTNETVACRADGKIAALHWNVPLARFDELWRAAGSGLSSRSEIPRPLLVDVDHNGQKEVLVACHTSNGKPGVQLLSSKGETLWECPIPAFVATYGDFDGDGHLDFYLGANVEGPGSVGKHLQSFAVSGRDGSTMWRNVGSADIVWHRQMAPTHQMPTVVDVNDDGCDDITLVALDLCTILDGKDGHFLQEPAIANTIWQQQEGKDGQWTAYGLQIPIDVDGDGTRDMLMAGAWGQFGAWALKDRKLLWTVDPGKAELARYAPGIADVDGDGKLEIGMIHEGGVFRCYDAANGNLKWEIPGLPALLDVVTADVDGDGKAEFLVGGTCIQAAGPDKGEIKWQLAVSSSYSPLVVDIDGDGVSELMYSGGDGKIHVFH